MQQPNTIVWTWWGQCLLLMHGAHFYNSCTDACYVVVHILKIILKMLIDLLPQLMTIFSSVNIIAAQNYESTLHF